VPVGAAGAVTGGLTDEELERAVRLTVADNDWPDGISGKEVRRQLEEEYGFSLADRRELIRDIIQAGACVWWVRGNRWGSAGKSRGFAKDPLDATGEVIRNQCIYIYMFNSGKYSGLPRIAPGSTERKSGDY